MTIDEAMAECNRRFGNRSWLSIDGEVRSIHDAYGRCMGVGPDFAEAFKNATLRLHEALPAKPRDVLR